MFAQSVLIKDLSKAQLSRVVMKKAVEMDQVDTNDKNKMACHDSKSGPVLYSECDAFKTTRREIIKILKARVQTRGCILSIVILLRLCEKRNQ
jgi:hypothetical protein